MLILTYVCFSSLCTGREKKNSLKDVSQKHQASSKGTSSLLPYRPLKSDDLNKIADARKECASSGVRRRTEGSMTFEQVSFCSCDAFPACG